MKDARSWILICAATFALALFAGCEKDDDNDNNTPDHAMAADFTNEAATAWMEESRLLVKSLGYSPPRAARLYGYVGQAIYESCVGGMPEHISLYGQINGMPPVPSSDPNLEYHWPAVVNFAAANILMSLCDGAPADTFQWIMNMRTQLHDEFALTVASDMLERSENYGGMVSAVINACAQADGYSTYHNCAFTVPTGPGLWIPTPPAFAANPLEPCWGSLRPLVISDINEVCQPPAPTAFDETVNSQFYNEMMEVYTDADPNNADHMAIANFWADGGGATSTPAGHWVGITGQILRGQNANLAVAVEIYCKVGIAMNDAFISCWNTKYDYNYIRPISCIRSLVDPNWLSPLATPPFPEYTSGHSTQSGAASVVLTDFFGAIAFTDTTHSAAGYPSRSFSNFIAAAEEAAISRLYGGIHYRPAIDDGIEQGQCIGHLVNALQFRANS
ncbi:vanadium-dependent haloperoxidase [bacterium]|nr:vanadium-dependent haloperoxidase [bacterium]